MEITEDFAYKRLFEVKEYIDELERRNISFARKAVLLESATPMYQYWKDQVKNFLMLKRKTINGNVAS